MKNKKNLSEKEKKTDENYARETNCLWYEKLAPFLSSPEYHIAYLSLICILVYSNTFHNAFQLDDFHCINNNPSIRYINPLWRHFLDPSTISTLPSNISYRPLVPLSLSITYALFKYNVAGYHLFNIIFQILVTVFLYLFFFNLLSFQDSEENIYYRVIAFFGALIFSIHPLSGFCVNYLCSRDNIMMVAFITVSLFWYVRMRKHGETTIGWVITLFFFLLSLFSKPIAIMVPFVVLEFELILARARIFSKGIWFRFWSFELTSIAVYIFVRYFTRVFQTVNGLNVHSYRDVIIYLMTQFKLHLFHYLRNFVWPFPIRGLPSCEPVTSPFEMRMLIGLCVILSSIIGAWYLRKKSPVLSFCIFAYWTMFIPTSSFIPIYQYVADRWMYPSLPYLSLILSIVIIRYIRPKFSIAIAVILVLYFGLSSFYMNRNWRDGISFYTQCARYGTDAIGYMNLGMSYLGKDDQKAKYYIEKSIEVAPYYYLAHINLGLWYINHGEKEKGLEMIRKGVTYTPAGCEPFAYYWFARALDMTGHHEEAFSAYKKTIDFSLNPDVQHLYDAAFNAHSIGKYRESLGYLVKIHERTENYYNSHFLTGSCYFYLGENEKAIEEYFLAIKYASAYARSYGAMGYALMKESRYKEAKGYFEKCLQLDPNDSDARSGLEECRRNINGK